MDIYELIGFLIGDGNIYYNKKYRVYRVEFAGNAEEDYDYFEQISDFLLKLTGKKAPLKIRREKTGNSLRIQFNNKKFVDNLISLGLPIGKKTFNIKVPEEMLKKKIMVSILKGLFEADGCLYFSKSKKIEFPTYPRIEIKSSSKNLVFQIEDFLKNEGFRVYIKKPKTDRTFGIYLNGEKMLEKWVHIFGLNSLKNRSKYEIWKAKGFYIPKTPLKNRIEISRGGPAATAVDF